MRKVKIGNKYVGGEEPCYLVFECGPTFDNFETAKKLAKAAADAGADAVKFQVLDVDRLMGDRSPVIEFTTAAGKRKGNLYEILKKRELTREQWKELKKYCDELGITFFATVSFPEDVDFLVDELGVNAIKIATGDLNHYYLIDYVSKKGVTILLDGRSNYVELEKGIEVCEKNGNKNIILMHCPSGYPARNDAVNLNVIPALRKLYNYPIGFSDHSRQMLMNYPAVVMGADILEKTLTLDKNTDFIEHLMSLEPEEAKEFVKTVKAVEEAKGSGRFIFSRTVNVAARRCLVAKEDIKKGEKIVLEKLDFRRPGDKGIECAEYEMVCTRKAKADIPKDNFITWDMVE